MIGKLFVATAIGASIVMAPHASAQKIELKVLCAVGMHQVMLELGPRFERASGHRLAITFGGTGGLAQRVS